MKRQIIKIDEEKCNGCGECIPNCPEGALQIIDGKARLISDLFCDGLGACIGECPLGAISTETREAAPYNERKVMEENIIKAGANTIKAHLKHLNDHGEKELYKIAVRVLQEKNIDVGQNEISEAACPAGTCPGVAAHTIELEKTEAVSSIPDIRSQLRQWPVQLHLMNSAMPYFDNAELLIAADCVPFTFANFHEEFVKGKIVINFCPKLDNSTEQYIEKLAEIFSSHTIKSIVIVRMEVPCCGGTEYIVQKALEKAGKKMTAAVKVISIKGEIN